ncbi:TraR/DksA family transcriptional regulator [Hyphococcus sp. DH-69]|uniref:TraR/DksA family transcriptional regulator n=1 Tax=Hyphococcus formosus TaxID=3143534 RepID=UPI00398AED97
MIDLDAFRLKLLARRDELETLSNESKDTRKPVELDQQSVGRLSRQDALQQQAMANAQEARRINEQRKIDAALKRLDEGEYGYCAECGEPIAEKRLLIDLTASFCAGCAR